MVFDPEDLWFGGTLQGAVVLLIEKKKEFNEKSLGLGIKKTKGRDFLNIPASMHLSDVQFRNGDTIKGKWTYALLNDEEFNLLKKIRENKNIFIFKDIASVDVGIVTGANKFFLVPDKTVIEYDLEEFAKPMFGRSEHCPGIIYDLEQHQENSIKGLPCNFLYFNVANTSELTSRQKKYIKLGENENLHSRYKCRIRKPWFKVPSVYSTEIGLLKRCHNFPKLILNKLGAYTTDTSYRIRFEKDHFNSSDFVFSFVNSLTALTAELEGRHYGGGVLELIPSEIEKLLVPLIHTTINDIEKLNINIRKNEFSRTLDFQDAYILKSCGISSEEIKMINQAWHRLRNRRQRNS
jgi:adenine-specific DNA methylase